MNNSPANPVDIAALIGDAIALLGNGIALFIFFWQKKIEKNQINESIKREVRNNLLKTCDKLHRYSGLLIENKLRVNFFEKMYDITIGTEQSFEYEKEYNFERYNFNKLNEKWFLQKGYLHGYKYDFNKLEKYDTKVLEEKLIAFEHTNILVGIDHVFDKANTTEETIKILSDTENDIRNILNKNGGSILIDIMKLLS